MRYETLLRILDKVRFEAPEHGFSKYRPDEHDIEKVNQARSRAYIHLYLKVMFGLADFAARERTITDGSGDGGIDGYYINCDTKTIYLIQSKFRTTEKNFEQKEIVLEELLSMDVARILDGEICDEHGVEYNGKIKQLQREISLLADVARYSYRVIILANLSGVSPAKLKFFTGGIAAEVINFEMAYEKLVFPVLTGSYFTASDIVIPVDLSNKNAGSKISYNVRTKYADCEITVLFVPTIEIAKIMNKYRNAILKFNPRSYLELEGGSVNAAIRASIVGTETNEFALYNNGITMLSEETNINEKIGQKNKAQLLIKNPQIINGGQTSFTLSRIYCEDPEKAEMLFLDKEVLLKIITLQDNESDQAKRELIDQVSTATNKQTTVINADRFANDAFHVAIQKMIFDRYGLLYERKRGEFAAGVNDGYVDPKKVVERNHFWRLYYSANGDLEKGKARRLFQKNQFFGVDIKKTEPFDRAFCAFNVFLAITKGRVHNSPMGQDIYAKIFMYIELMCSEGFFAPISEVEKNLPTLEVLWKKFFEQLQHKYGQKKKAYIDRETGEAKIRNVDTVFRCSPLVRKYLGDFIEEVKGA